MVCGILLICVYMCVCKGARTGPACLAGARPMLVRETDVIEMEDRRFKQVFDLG